MAAMLRVMLLLLFSAVTMIIVMVWLLLPRPMRLGVMDGIINPEAADGVWKWKPGRKLAHLRRAEA